MKKEEIVKKIFDVFPYSKGIKVIDGYNFQIAHEDISIWDSTTKSFQTSLDTINPMDFIKLFETLISNANYNINSFRKRACQIHIMDSFDEFYKTEELIRNKVLDIAKSMYKRPSKIQSFVESTMESNKLSMIDKLPIIQEEIKITKFRIDDSFGTSNSVRDVILTGDKILDQGRFLDIWNSIKDNELYREITGIRFVYTSYNPYFSDFGNPTIEFIFTPKGEEIYNKNKERLTSALEKYYETASYTGD